MGMVPGTFKTKHMCTLIPLSCCFPWYGVKLLDYSLLCPIIKDNLGLIGHTANRGRDLTTEMGSGSTREGEGLQLPFRKDQTLLMKLLIQDRTWPNPSS